MKRFLIIPRLKIHNANALSSPYTIGFPAMTAWLGGVHALQRKLNAASFTDLRFSACAVSCHQIDLQTYQGRGDYVHSIVGTGNPLDKTGGRPSFIKAFRTPKAKADVYTLFDRFARGGELSQTEQHYVMAVLVRGGVFGESGKD